MKRPVFDAETRARIGAARLQARRAMSADDGRAATSHVSRGAVEFRDHLPYSPGDDLRRVDWNLYGRLDQLYVRRFTGESRIEQVFVLDNSKSMGIEDGQKSLFARRFLAMLAVSALDAGRDVKIAVLRETLEVPPRTLSGRKDEPAVFERLETIPDPLGVADFGAVRALFRPGPHLRIVSVISDFLAEDAIEKLLAHPLERRVEAGLFALHLPSERAIDALDMTTLVECETGEKLEIAPSKALAERYAEAFAQWLESVRTHVNAKGAHFSASPAEAAFEAEALRVIRQGAFA